MKAKIILVRSNNHLAPGSHYEVRGKSEIRNPKSEGSPKSEIRKGILSRAGEGIRRHLAEARDFGFPELYSGAAAPVAIVRQPPRLPLGPAGGGARKTIAGEGADATTRPPFSSYQPGFSRAVFGFRISDFIRISDFGFRIFSSLRTSHFGLRTSLLLLLTTSAFVPQALKSWSSRDLSGVSLSMYSLFTLGVALWLLYGIALQSWPIILANCITLALAGLVLSLKISHLRRK